MPTRNLTVMFTDIQGFTSRTSNSTRDGVRSLLEEHDRLLRPVFRHFDGVVVKTIGDAFLVRFESPTDAVVCGLTLQAVLKKHNEKVSEDERISVRVAINVGDVELMEGDVLGEPVNIAARLEGIAQPGEVWFTEAVYLTMNRKEVPTTEIGERVFKGIPHPIRVYKVLAHPPNEQILQIDKAVRIERGVPKFEGLREAAGRRRDLRPWLAALVLALLVGPLAAVMGYDAWKAEQALARAERLLELNDPAPALAILDELLAERPDEARLRELGRVAVERELERRLSAAEPLNQTRDWLEERLARQGHLAPLRERLADLDAQVRLAEAFRRGGSAAFWESFRGLLSRYPQSPAVPLAAARALRANHQMAETALWPYELLIERAGVPTDPALREEISGAVFHTLSRNLPNDDYAQTAHRLARNVFPDDRRRWAERGLVEGGGLALVNAVWILAELQDPRADEPLHRALRDLLEHREIVSSVAVLAAERDVARGARIRDVLSEARLDMSSHLSPAERAMVEGLMRTLRERSP